MQTKDPRKSVKLPEESHSPNRIYAIFNKNCNDVQAVAKYGPDGKKIWEIHTRDHNGLGAHYHPCEDGHAKIIINRNGYPESEAYALDAEKRKFLIKSVNMENKNYISKDNDPRDYVGYDLFGFPFNKKYPPNKLKYGDLFEGYSNKAQGVLLYDFCVIGYDVEFHYKGKEYFLLNTGEGIISNCHSSDEKVVYDSPMALIENFSIDGKTLLELAPEIKDIEPV